MKKIVTMVILLVCLGKLSLKSQQIPLFNSSVLNPFLENPAVAGANPYSQSFLLYRQQWADIEGAPESAILSVDWPLKDEKSGLGLIVSSDKANILGQTGVAAGYSHGIHLGDAQWIRLGLSLKLSYNTIYFDKVQAEDEYESTLFNYFESATGLNSNFGVSYRYKSLQAGIIGKNLLNSKIEYTNKTEDKELYFQYIPQYLIHVNYTYCLPNEICLRPEVALRDIHGTRAQFEASLFASWQGKYSTAIVYRNSNSLGFVASALIYDRLTVGYSYQVAMGKIAGYNGGTHEITLGYRFYTSHFKDQKPVDNEKLDQILEFAQKQVDDNKDLQKQNQDLQQQQKELREELLQGKEEIDRLKEQMTLEQAKYEKAKEEDETEIENIPEEMLNNLNEPIYIILGVFSGITEAKSYQQILRRENQLGTEVLKRRNTNDYIVCVNRKFETKNDLRKEVSKLNKITRNYHYSDVWIYVNE
jgi:type IX secretion system PorP/SprF family membrane protein